MRIFGIGKQTQWSTDTVTISLRAVSVNTGKVLSVVTVQKTILSTADSATALKFFDQGTQAFEAELGMTINEPGTYAVKAATEMAVVELIKEGARKGIWEYRTETPAVVHAPKPEVKAPVISSEIKKEVEDKKDVVVQPEAVPEAKQETVPSVSPEVKVIEKKSEPKPLFGQRKLKEAEFIYKESNDSSQRTWQFKKGTVIDIKQPGSDGWVRVSDSESRGGWIRLEKLEEVK
jgi:curli production assembly/transport component CsgG